LVHKAVFTAHDNVDSGHILTLAASAIGALLQGSNTLELEREKSQFSQRLETQKQQHELVLKMISVTSPEQAKVNMQFLAESGLIAEDIAKKILATKAIPLIPPRRDSDALPPRPDFSPVTSAQRASAWNCDYEIEPDDTGRGVRILDDWEKNNIVSVPIPQLRKALGDGAPESMRFNIRGAEALKAAWAEVEEKKLLDRLVSFDGSFVARLVRGSQNRLTNHACGAAFDINAQYNLFGSPPAPIGAKGSVLELVPIFNKHGFYWGGHFRRPDGMHFELAVSSSEK
jgi:hypothetical protein